MGEDEILDASKILIREISIEPDGSILAMNEMGTVSEVELCDKSQNDFLDWMTNIQDVGLGDPVVPGEVIDDEEEFTFGSACELADFPNNVKYKDLLRRNLTAAQILYLDKMFAKLELFDYQRELIIEIVQQQNRGVSVELQPIERPELKPKKKSQNSTKRWKREKKYY